MKNCDKCGNEMSKRSFAYHLFTLTLKIAIPITILGGIFSDFLLEVGMVCVFLIPYLALMLYPFKLGNVYKCKNDNCKEVEYVWTEKFSCSSCESDTKRVKKTVKISLRGALVVFIGAIIALFSDGNIAPTFMLCGICINIFAIILEKVQRHPVILKCKSCGQEYEVKEETVIEYGL